MNPDYQLTVRDLVVVTALVAVHFAVSRLSVSLRGTGVIYLAFTIPSFLTALLHGRLGLGWKTATIMHFVIAVGWGFLFGVTCSLFWRQMPRSFSERDSIDLQNVLAVGILSAVLMAFLAMLTTTIYGAIAYHLSDHDAESV